MSWPGHGAVHYRTGWITISGYGRRPLIYCQSMNPVQVRDRHTGGWGSVTCKNCRAKRFRERGLRRTAA